MVLAGSKAAGASIGWAVAAGTLAALLYGIGANMVRKYLTGTPPGAVAGATLSCAALFTLPFALAHWPEQAISLRAWAAAGLLGVLCTGIAFVMYYRLIKRIGPARAVTVTYLVPLFGVLWGWLFLDERVTLGMLAGAGLVMAALALVLRR